MRLQMFVYVGAPLHQRWNNQITPLLFFFFLIFIYVKGRCVCVCVCVWGWVWFSLIFHGGISRCCLMGSDSLKAARRSRSWVQWSWQTEASPPAHRGVFYPQSGSTWSTSENFQQCLTLGCLNQKGWEAFFVFLQYEVQKRSHLVRCTNRD